MLARLQTVITLGLLLVAVAWGIGATALGHPRWAGACAAAIVMGYALFMALEFAVMWCVHGDDPTPRARPTDLLRAWWGEVATAPRIFCWQQPFQSHRFPNHLPAQSGRHGVLLVHGFLCNRGFWNRWMPRLCELGIPFVAVNLEPAWGSIAGHADLLERAARQLEQATGRAPVIVAHSMGGLVVRSWLAQHSGASRVHRVITLGTPHHGTWSARCGMAVNAREMRQGSPLLQSLRCQEAAEGYAHFICFYSHCDNIVFPASTATLQGADNRHVQGRAHVHLMDYGGVFDEVVKQATLGGTPKAA